MGRAAQPRAGLSVEEDVRRRGIWRGRGGGGGRNRLLERLGELKKLGLSDVAGLGQLPRLPEGIELGRARFEGRPRAVVASKRDGLDLLGWARVAALRAGEDRPVREVLVAAPVLSDRTRRAAERASRSGPFLELIAVPSLAQAADEIFDAACLASGASALPIDDAGSVLARVVRVVEGAVAVASAGGVRPTGDAHAIYLRGERVGLVTREGDGAIVTMLVPDRHRIQVTDANFARWGPDLHEMIVQLAQDPRLLEAESARSFEQAAADAGAHITARWIPWSADGADPLDWSGVDSSGRPVLGASAESVGLAEVPRLIAGLCLLEEARELWVPRSVGPVRLVLACNQLDPEAQSLLEPALGDFEPGGFEEPPGEAPEPRGRRGRRRSRRRRRRPDEVEREEAGTSELEVAGQEPPALSLDEPSVEEPEFAAREMEDLEEPEEAGSERESSRRRSRGRRPRSQRGRGERAADETRVLEVPASAADEPESKLEVGEQGEELKAESEGAELENEATLVEADEDVPTPAEETPPRRRRARAGIIVRDDPDCILAALVLARDRRSVVSFRICTQEGLMDFFRGPATDIPENTDVLLVGFTPHPHPTDTLNTAELFRGRLQWFDHHEWAIEDLERLREAIGDDAVLVVEGASGPLPAVARTTERRSRFTDKLVELSGRRLSEGDMEKWGYRVIGLIASMASRPGEYRAEIAPLLSGKAAELPKFESVYQDEIAWIEEHDARIVHFGEYQMAVVRVPPNLDAGEIARRVRLTTGARLSLSSREGEALLLLGCNEERRPINVVGLADHVGAQVAWAHPRQGGDRVGRIEVDELQGNPERIDTLIVEMVRNRSVLHG